MCLRVKPTIDGTGGQRLSTSNSRFRRPAEMQQEPKGFGSGGIRVNTSLFSEY